MGATVRFASFGFRRGHRASLLIVLAVVTLAATGLAAGLSVAKGATSRIDDAFRSANGPDLVVYADPGDTKAVSDALAGDRRVVTVAEPVRALSASLQAKDGHTIDNSVQIHTSRALAVGQPVLHSGRFPRAADELTIDAGVASDQGIHIGDTVTLHNGDRSATYGVVGTAYDFTDCFYPQCDPGRNWVTEPGLERLGQVTREIINVRTTNSAVAAAAAETLDASLGDDANVGANTWLDTRGDLVTETDFFAVFLGVFGIFVLAASAVVIAAAIAARAISTRRRIGLCKALGATQRQIGSALLVEHIGIAVLAACTGWAVAALLTPHLRVGSLRVVGSPNAHFALSSLALTIAVIVAVVAIVTLVPALRAGRAPTTDAIRDAPSSAPRARQVARAASRVTSPAVSSGIRTWLYRPARTVISVIAVGIAVVGAVVSMTVNTTVDRLLANPTLTGDPWQVAVTPTAMADRHAFEAALDASPAVAGWYTTTDDRVSWHDNPLHLQALGGDPDAAAYAIGEGRSPEHDGEAIVSYGLIADWGWRIGDRVDLTTHGSTVAVTVVGWYRDTEDSGHIIQVRDGPGRLVRGSLPTYNLIAAPGVEPKELARQPMFAGMAVDVNHVDAGAMQPFRIAMAMMTVLVTLVALAHLFGTTLITARERGRQVSILRSVGYTRMQSAADAATTALLSAAVAVVTGVLVGRVIAGKLGDSITSAVGIGPGVTPPASLWWLVMLAVGMSGLAVAVAVVAQLSTTRRPIAQLLRAD